MMKYIKIRGSDIIFVEVFSQIVQQNTYHDFILALIFFASGITLVRLTSYISGKLQKWLNKRGTKIDIIPILRSRVFPLLYFAIFYISINRLILHQLLSTIINYIALILIVFYGITLLQKLTIQWLHKYWGKKEQDDSKKQIFEAVILAVKVTIWFIAGLIILDNMGVKISGLIAGLGIGGVAIAFAAQAILEDIFSYFIIFFDRPFEIGDFIIIGEFMGTIEHIGLKTTHIRSLGGEQLIFSNKDLINSRVKNYKRMKRRRILFNFGVVYQTSLDNLQKIQGIVRGIIEEQDLIDFDRCHFKAYGEYSLIFEVVYYVNNRDYNVYMNINHQILLRMNEEFGKEGINFAYPTQSIYLHSENG